MVNSYLNAFTDILLFLLPMPLIYKLQIHIKQKAAITIIFFTGLIPVAASIVRSVHLTQSYEDRRQRWSLIPFWSHVETTLGIVAACIPALKPLLKAIYRRLGIRTSTAKSTNASKSVGSSASPNIAAAGNRTTSRITSPVSLQQPSIKLDTSGRNSGDGGNGKSNKGSSLPPFFRHQRRINDNKADDGVAMLDYSPRAAGNKNNKNNNNAKPKNASAATAAAAVAAAVAAAKEKEEQTSYPFRPPPTPLPSYSTTNAVSAHSTDNNNDNNNDNNDDIDEEEDEAISDSSLEDYFRTHLGGSSSVSPTVSARSVGNGRMTRTASGMGMRMRMASDGSNSSSMRRTGVGK
ncbi:hypothetical protein BK809_0004932 [Diplodia seriata]|uniref:Rhodopsin domain-containing protein n=1 Tax=Diplodia seriata TaxID=420778 RepID=A0A1S8B8L2_9PEZI|nr:hypothetical protein BK809_0004932 [Diplodia seriata]